MSTGEFGTLGEMLTKVEHQPGGIALAAQILTRLHEITAEMKGNAYSQGERKGIEAYAARIQKDLR